MTNDEIIIEYLNMKLPDHRNSRAKALATRIGVTPLEIRKIIVESGHSLVGCDVQAYNKQTMTSEEKELWQKNTIDKARRSFWDNISKEDLEFRRQDNKRRMIETVARLKSDPEAYKTWRDKQKVALEKTYKTTDVCNRISKSVKERYRKYGPNGCHKSSFDYKAIIDGKTIIFDSGWEFHCYKQLSRLGEVFTYAGKRGIRSATNWIAFSQSNIKAGWNPDFILLKKDTIIEVKGRYPPVLKKWNEVDLPAILKEQLPYNIYLMDFNCSKKQYKTLDDMLADCKLVYQK